MKNEIIHKRRLADKRDSGDSIIAPNTKLTGRIKGTEGIVVKGSFKGDVECKRLVWLELGGKIRGNVKSPNVIIDGELTGNIESADHVELGAGSRMIGNIETVNLAMAEGSFFEGEIHMPKREKETVSFVEKRKNIK